MQQEYFREQYQPALVVPNVRENKERLIGVHEDRKDTCLGKECFLLPVKDPAVGNYDSNREAG